jgi:hypothetical protein
MRRRVDRAGLAFGVLVLGALALFEQQGEAHKPITSKYTYNDDVFPIFKARCSRCHVPGGVAPMSLMTYEEAFPWAESIRAELVAAHMPPATVDDGFGNVAHAQGLSPKDVDVILTWASGGNPRGSLEQKLPTVELKNDWTLGKPDLAVPLTSEFTLAADKMEDTYEFTVPTGIKDTRWVRAVDLLPGNPAIVRSAVVAVRNVKNVKGASDAILARWLPGQDPQQAEEGAAFRLPPGAELAVQIRYKKTWSYEGKVMKDRSSVGIYFAEGAGERELTSVPLMSEDIRSMKGQTFTFSKTLDRDVQAFAVSPDQVPDNLTLKVEAVRPDGSRTPMIRFAARPEWKRRYWFAQALTLPRGTKVEVTGTMGDPDLIAAAFGGPVSSDKTAGPSKVTLDLDVVSARERPSVP